MHQQPDAGHKSALRAVGMLAATRYSVVATAAQLGLALFVVWRFKLESRTFFDVMALVCAGFVVHALLPLQVRLGFFAALSLATIFVAFGWYDGACLIALGLVLIGICHLQLALRWRVAILLGTAALFALWRAQLMPGPWSSVIWPILGSMFMFRIALYLHALEHDEKQPTPARTLAYFFMAPNVCFPLYPVIDYLTFRRTWFDRAADEIYATGMKWIARGLLHLILYRLVYVHFTADAIELASMGELVQFLLATFALYLRVSGQFHLIVGMLHLFGFRLPETHHLYFLSSSFTDFWRRINIYWKDFMMKLVYYPSFFRLKRFGTTTALVGATIIVFAGTWLLHSYQWFWLRGGFPLEPQDAAFWGLLGVLVVFGALREMKRSRPRKLGATKPRWSWSLAWRTVGTFAAICILWSLWSAESISTWIVMWSAAQRASVAELLALAVLLCAALAIAGWPWPSADAAGAGPASTWRRTLPAATLAGLTALSFTGSYAAAAPTLAAWVASLQRTTLNARDAALQHKGYYENLDNASRLSAQLWDVGANKPAHWLPLGATSAYRTRDDFLGGELRENASVMFLDQPLHTNSFGMRDRERVLLKPAGVYRIAVLGPSHVMGSGVADDVTFTRLLEEQLNARKEGLRYEVLNFGVAAYALTQQVASLRQKVLRFAPDAVLFVDSPRLGPPAVQHLLRSIAHRHEVPFERLHAVARSTGVQQVGEHGVPVPFDAARSGLRSLGIATRMPWSEADRRLRFAAEGLVGATLAEAADIVRMNNAVPVFVALDNVVDAPAQPVKALDQARQAGMMVFDLLGLWAGRDQPALRIAPWDNHPNAQGNRLIAEALSKLIEESGPPLQLRERSVVAPVSGTSR